MFTWKIRKKYRKKKIRRLNETKTQHLPAGRRYSIIQTLYLLLLKRRFRMKNVIRQSNVKFSISCSQQCWRDETCLNNALSLPPLGNPRFP